MCNLQVVNVANCSHEVTVKLLGISRDTVSGSAKRSVITADSAEAENSFEEPFKVCSASLCTTVLDASSSQIGTRGVSATELHICFEVDRTLTNKLCPPGLFCDDEESASNLLIG